MVVDPITERAVLRWPGSATSAQLARLLDDGRRALAVGDGAAGAGDGDGGLSSLARADRIGGARDAGAVEAYREALARVAPDKRPRVVESLVLAQLAAHDYQGCALTATSEAPALPRGPSFANVAATGLSCAEAAPSEASWRARAITALEPLAREAVELPGLLADDRSGLFEVLADAREEAGDKAGVQRVAEDWLAFLERQAAAAPTPEARASFDPHRVGAALKLGAPARAVAALQQTERDLPADYNAPARLALLYKAMGRLDDAQAAIERALKLAYGPRTVRLLEMEAQIEEARGDRAAARATLERAVRTAEALPAAQGRDKLVEKFRALLAKAGAAPTR